MAERLFDLAIEKSNELYIYGTGIKAGEIFCRLRDMGALINGFIDRDDSDRIGTFFWGRKVCALSEVDQGETIIIASVFWKEIEERLIQKGYRNLYVDNSLIEAVEASDSYLLGAGDYQFYEDITYVVCPYGIGDTLYVCAFLDEFKKEKSRCRVCVIAKKSHGVIPKGFSFIDKVICDDALVEKLNNWAIRTGTWELKNFLYGHFKKKLDMIFIRSDNVILDSMITQYRREVMGLSEHSRLSWDDFSLEKSEDDALLDSNSVVLMPFANSIKTLEMGIWVKLSDELKKRGYSVYTNVKGPEEAPIDGTLPITGDISHVASITRNCKAVIALRSGLCDVLAFCKISMIVIYTDPNMYREWDLRYISDDLPIKNVLAYDWDEELLIGQIISEILELE